MSAKIAINGFGRIGRLALRAMTEQHKDDLTVVAINDMADFATAHPELSHPQRLCGEPSDFFVSFVTSW